MGDFSNVVHQFSPDSQYLFLHTTETHWEQYTNDGTFVFRFDCGDRFRVFNGFLVCVSQLGSFLYDYRLARPRGEPSSPWVWWASPATIVGADPNCPWAVVPEPGKPLRLYNTTSWEFQVWGRNVIDRVSVFWLGVPARTGAYIGAPLFNTHNTQRAHTRAH